MKGFLVCFCTIFLLLAMTGCDNSQTTSETSALPGVQEAQESAAVTQISAETDAEPGTGPPLRLTAQTDCTEAFQPSEELTLGNEAGSLLLSYFSDGEAAISEESISLSEASDLSISLVATWAHSGEVLYFGVVNEEETKAWTASLTGGSAVGTLCLTNLPAGTYHVLAFAENGPNVMACLYYSVEGNP